jgi:hypothetical protein
MTYTEGSTRELLIEDALTSFLYLLAEGLAIAV